MRLVFAGTPDAAVPSLHALAASSHEIVAVVTRPDAPLGRKRVLTPSPVAAAAAQLGLEVVKAERLDPATTEVIRALRPDLGVIVAYGGLVREPLLSNPSHGWVNLHFSKLPQWRGAAPVQRAIMAGETELTASVFQLVAALDAGDVFAERTLAMPQDVTAGDALTLLAADGAHLLVDVVDAIADGSAQARPQTGEATYAHKLSDDDGRIDWQQPRAGVLARWRGVTPEPGAHTVLTGARVKLLAVRAASADDAPLAPGEIALQERELRVGTLDHPVVLERVQPAGKGAMAAADWWRGLRVETARFDPAPDAAAAAQSGAQA
ncbi:methionyl-tRNA formyltransferase [Microbacterium fluvii]|uniref:Methionyl-tRNA formyltransferase n=1 Tax=Microbacterium fluvii TaxID=415215 RepID=A0ABW2HEP8_9MICO|nr:methionyl-tRNA formyltransferase [Microbacterium fluvii]MCU4672046.1 methionyl-tRNA formyltransferase [Microbacterium fluvii]